MGKVGGDGREADLGEEKSWKEAAWRGLLP